MNSEMELGEDFSSLFPSSSPTPFSSSCERASERTESCTRYIPLTFSHLYLPPRLIICRLSRGEKKKESTYAKFLMGFFFLIRDFQFIFSPITNFRETTRTKPNVSSVVYMCVWVFRLAQRGRVYSVYGG